MSRPYICPSESKRRNQGRQIMFCLTPCELKAIRRRLADCPSGDPATWKPNDLSVASAFAQIQEAIQLIEKELMAEEKGLK